MVRIPTICDNTLTSLCAVSFKETIEPLVVRNSRHLADKRAHAHKGKVHVWEKHQFIRLTEEPGSVVVHKLELWKEVFLGFEVYSTTKEADLPKSWTLKDVRD